MFVCIREGALIFLPAERLLAFQELCSSQMFTLI